MSNFEGNRFKTISDFKWCVDCGGEIEFEWKDRVYSITHTPKIPSQISIAEAYKEETELCADTADEALEYIVGGDRLRDVITQVKVWDRTI